MAALGKRAKRTSPFGAQQGDYACHDLALARPRSPLLLRIAGRRGEFRAACELVRRVACRTACRSAHVPVRRSVIRIVAGFPLHIECLPDGHVGALERCPIACRGVVRPLCRSVASRGSEDHA
jgi:hypothetical protein